jgi:hypothetical protein
MQPGHQFVRLAFRLVTAIALVLVGGGCTSAAIHHASSSYYVEGPDQALQALDGAPIRHEDRILASMERAVALQELGAYEDSNLALSDGLRELETSPPDPIRLLVNDEAGRYRGEYFERVYLHTLAIANSLALQQTEEAASHGEHALDAIVAVGCPSCRFPFTRYLAALANEATGQLDRAVNIMAEAVAESPGLGYLDSELERMQRQAMLVDYPSPGSSLLDERVMVVILLLGRGPQKVASGVPVPPSHAVTWPVYVPRGPQAVVGAELAVAGARLGSVILTDVGQLARSSLAARRRALIPKEVAKTAVQEAVVQEIGHEVDPGAEWLVRLLFSLADRADLRHWSTLPATCQVIRASIPVSARDGELLFLGPDSGVVDGELIEFPESWTGGPLFVTRRMP